MANPNIVNVTSILGQTDLFALTTTQANLVTCASDKVVKLNSILISNIDGTSAADVTIKMDDGSASRAIASTISVPADSSLQLIDKNSGFYLNEADVLQGTASANSDLECLVSYDIIDDA
tara:strand:- start:232 stop:591 length:360 start_codon:yes stop_codon:yes gene_type:complete